ncbi:ABC transporter, substrate-binding protein, aliphatic sulfonates family [Tepidimonas alkaliphilus]|uniref:ABC transporter, substrate-binding protein, aliphatic sulfonates family n=1 Tax=Tepidimonas alkaliphilus TaxID=2588942 RepID=A0A554W8F2_9BURK|nr:ABC transporter substrate-binding protein [Tepidimonas alkaliphilus]TSE19853.1 ABC transporter, substrate-binding protein, aliphatic sulfonates family [Tepidimonas alkaliphilus]
MNLQRRAWLRCVALGGSAAGLAAALSGCGREPALTVAYHPWPGYAPLHLADSLGWWDDGQLRSLPTASATASHAALAEGRAQVAALTLDEVLLAHAQGLALRVVGLLNLSHGADVVLARAGFEHPARWRGARLGREAGALGELMALSWLEYADLGVHDVQMLTVRPDEHERAFMDGSVDLLVTYEPVATRLRALGARRLFDSSQLPAQRPIADVLAAHTGALRRQPRALRRLLRHTFQAQSHLLKLPVDARLRLAPWLGVAPAQVMATFRGLRLTRWHDNRHWLMGHPAPLQQAAESLARFLFGVGLLPHPRVAPELISPDALPAQDPP